MEVKKIVNNFIKQLKAQGNPDRAEHEKKYLKSPFKFYGVSAGQIDAVIKDFKKNNKEIAFADLENICDTMWASGWHEQRSMAVRLWQKYPEHITIKLMPKLEKMLYESMNWDQVDEISAHLVGGVLEKDLEKGKKYLIKWSKDKNFWLRRASMLSQLVLLRNGRGDKELFFKLAEPMLNEGAYSKAEFETKYMPEKMGKFFIRKVIGWILRDMSRRHPEAIIPFVKKNKENMSGLTLREATRLLPEKFKKQLT